MTRRGLMAVCAAGLLLAAACSAVGAGINFAPSTYNPGVGEAVTFQVCQTCLGGGQFRFTWAFGEDGSSEVTTTDLSVTRSFDHAGYVRVALAARDSSGRAFSRTKEILVGESPLVAVREASPEDRGTILVTVTLLAREALSGLGLTETVPRGWQAQEIDRGGATVVNPIGQTLEVLWAEAIDAGQQRVFAYRLLPTSAGGLPELSGTASAYVKQVATGEPQKRVQTTVCGDVAIPDY